jgi:hypothetical protein
MVVVIFLKILRNGRKRARNYNQSNKKVKKIHKNEILTFN